MGSVDTEAIGDVLGVDVQTADGETDVSSIPDAFVADDPKRAAALGRFVSLIQIDEATEWDVGRLWEDGLEGEGDDGEGDDVGGPERRQSAESSGEPDGPAEEIRSRLSESLSSFRDRIEEARGDLDDSSGSGEGSPDDESVGDRSRSSTGIGSTSRSRRSPTAFSTVPTNRHDVGSTSRLSTMPGRRGRSESSGLRSLTSDEDGDGGQDEGPGEGRS